MSVVIDAENISKRFFLGERNQRAFFEDVAAKSVRGFRRLVRPREGKNEKVSKRDFWALRDVSFRIFQGQTLGIIGENAGQHSLKRYDAGALQKGGAQTVRPNRPARESRQDMVESRTAVPSD